MNAIYEYECREAAEAALARMGEITRLDAWSANCLDQRIDTLEAELNTLKVILAAWQLAEGKRRAIASSNPIMEETTEPQEGETNNA